MPLFRRGRPSPLDDAATQAEAEHEQALSRERIERGGLPVRAERRLKELAADPGFFTSELTTAEFALTRLAGLRPVSQVMGSCVYHVGWVGAGAAWSWGGDAFSWEVTVLADAWNEARRRALSRLQEEAEHAEADAVVGVHISRGAYDWAADAIEFVAIGTAVRGARARPRHGPALTNLSVQDYWKLDRAGYQALGVVGASTVYFVRPSWGTRMVQQSGIFGPGAYNQELPEFTQGLYDARETALRELNQQATAMDAHGVVGVQIEQRIRAREIGAGPGGGQILEVMFHVLGTAISDQQRPADQPLPIDAILPLNG
jgi:uncharacterized protein YbjQ (UPF0145 family)